MSSATLADLLTPDALAELADPGSLARGKTYLREGRVRGLFELDGQVTATVVGTGDYRVRLWAQDGDLAWECTCPRAADGTFCKHLVAAALAWLDEKRSSDEGAKPGGDRAARRRDVTADEMRAYLSTLDRGALVDRLLQVVLEDAVRRESLALEILSSAPGRLDLDAFRRLVDRTVEVREYVGYGQMPRYANSIGQIVQALRALPAKGLAKEAIELTEYALAAVERAADSVDDSDGWMSGILGDLEAVHVEACRIARPDPEELAERLFAWEMRSEREVFAGASESHAEALGERGLARFRALAEKQWADVPSYAPGESPRFDCVPRLWPITNIMLHLARQTGDVDEWVAVRSRDLSLPYQFLEIALAYHEVGRFDDALKWAEAGLKAFPKRPEPRLREFIADERHRRGEHAAAMELIWKNFTEAPMLSCFKTLKNHAHRAECWPEWKVKALAHLRETLTRQRTAAKSAASRWDRPGDSSALVEILLYEKDDDGAWREARSGGCAPYLWLALAEARRDKHPEDALAVYQEDVAAALAHTGEAVYEHSISMLLKIKALLERLGRADEFGGYVGGLREQHRRKRNLLKRLDARGW